MYWKYVKTHLIDKLIFKNPKSWSITFRLTLIYTFSALFILFFTTITLYWIFTTRLEKENKKFLTNNILVLQKLLQNESNDNKEFLQEEIITEPEIYHYYVRIIKNDKTILETPHMSEHVPKIIFNHIHPPELDAFRSVHWTFKKSNQRTKHYLLMSALIDENRDRVIQIAKDISAERDIVADYRQGLLFVLFIGVVVSAMFGVLVARQGLKPLRVITKSTRRITVEKLKDRLNPSSWPKELFELALAFNEMLDRIESGFNRLSQFSGDLAHELRTPITNLMGEAEIALSRPRSKEEYREVLGSSLEELERLSHLIDDILFLARAENPKKLMNYTEIETKKMIEDICYFYEMMAEEKNIKIIHEGNILINVDTCMIRRALSNLVSNAIKHTDANGLISITTGMNQNKNAYITVSDNGTGIPAKHLPHVLDRFYRVDNARSQKLGGSGLGLAIVKFIMNLHGGSIYIESEINKGTNVTLLFSNTI